MRDIITGRHEGGKSGAESASVCLLLCFFIGSMLFVTGCSHAPSRRPATTPKPSISLQPRAGEETLARMGYTIQVGAFSNAVNAGKLTEYLNEENLDAYYFVFRKGLYKVRFGNFPTRELAHREAVILQAMGVIGEFYIVSPGEYAVARKTIYGNTYLRDEIVKTARSFIGVPYRWGGVTKKKGFDCSGLAMAVYKLNGLNLPRTSREQYRAGSYIPRSNLVQGDLVFFDTRGKGEVSHVGVYIGGGRFIHAPRRGKTVRISNLASSYYRTHYSGARKYF